MNETTTIAVRLGCTLALAWFLLFLNIKAETYKIKMLSALLVTALIVLSIVLIGSLFFVEA